jgi:2-dehydro-3-deoxyphosphogluconate aldolase/(4S)-4-hydroxy-2-oxoglutarate aldolase
MPADSAVLGSTPLVAIVRFPEGGPVLDAVDALVRGGIELVEITIDTPGALEAVEQAASDGKTVGVGTILTADQVRAAALAGARFVVSPGLIPDVIDAAHELGLEPMPGVFTATEIIAATEAGAGVMKLFPASYGGPSYLRALRGPFPASALVPTGGVRLDEVSAYLEAGAFAVGLGSELVGRSAPRSDTELEWIAAQAARAVAAARNLSLIDGSVASIAERPAPVESER